LSSFKKVPGWEPIVELLKRLPVRLPLGVSPKIGKADRPEAGLNLFEQPVKTSFSASC
jgi:hypothetical protein